MSDSKALENQLAYLSARVRELEQGLDPAVLSIAENAPSNIMLLDREACIQYINHTVVDLTRDQVLGTSVFNYVGQRFHARMRAAFDAVLRTKKPGRYETWYESEEGDKSWWESSVGPVVRDLEVVGFAVISSNVTEQLRRTAEEERFFNLSVDMLCVAGFDGYLKRVNPAFKTTLGLETELLGKPFIAFVHPEDREPTQQALKRLAAGEQVLDFENRCLCKDGSYRLLSWRAVADAQRTFISAVARDVTDRHALEERLRQSQKMEAIGQLAGGVAHDFNNLLLAIQGNIELAKRGDTEHLDEAIKATERAAALTHRLLAFSRKKPLTKAPLRLDEVISGLRDMLVRLTPENIQLEFGTPQTSPVVADKGQLEQLIVNLCVNARDAIPDGGTITLTAGNVTLDKDFADAHPAAKTRNYVLLTVADTGVGIADEEQKHLFEPFYTTKAPGRGTGLGLATVYGVAQQHGGFVDVESALGLGTTFRVYLPAAVDVPVVHSAPQRLPATGGSETILVAEDDPVVRNVVVHLLQHAGYSVITAENGTLAVEAFAAHANDISLALLDVTMPGLDGPGVARHIRNSHPEMKVLFTSGYADNAFDGDALEFLEREQVLHKPYRPVQLLHRLRELLDSTTLQH
jgi:PAS domain S-box-containing protein